MSDNVVELDCVSSIDVPPDRILKRAQYANLTDVVVIGYDDDGQFFFASSTPEGPQVLWLMELTRTRLVQAAEDLSDGE